MQPILPLALALPETAFKPLLGEIRDSFLHCLKGYSFVKSLLTCVVCQNEIITNSLNASKDQPKFVRIVDIKRPLVDQSLF